MSEGPSQPSGAARVLLVIPTLNEAAHLGGVVERLLEDAPDATVVAVVDGGSTDGTADVARALRERFPRLSLLHNPKRIQSAAVNLAARLLGRDADVLVRCDAHSVYPPRFVARLLETLDRTGADSVVVPLDSEGTGVVQRAVAWVSNSRLGTGGAAHRAGRASGFVDHGHHAAFRMSTFRKVGGYDETFTHNEDAEFDCRQRALGARVFLDATIRVGYFPRASFGDLFRQYRAYGAGRSRTARRHPGSLRLRQIAVPLHLGACVTAAVLAPVMPALLLWPLAYGACLAAASLGFAIRHRSPAGLLSGPAALVMHAGWGIGFVSGLVASRERTFRPELFEDLRSAPGDLT